MQKTILILVTATALFSLGCTDDNSNANDQPLFEVIRGELSGHLEVIVHPTLSESQELFIRVRNGGIGILNCAGELGQLTRIDGNPLPPRTPGDGDRFDGPFVDAQAFVNPYSDAWLEQEPTLEMLAAVEAGLYTIDLCLMEDGVLVRGAEMDIMRALDKKGTGKFDGYGDADEQIASVSAYAEACVAQIGEIPFFEVLEDGDYTTYSCLDSTPIPMTVTDAEGNVTRPEETQSSCDNPQFIYSSCEPNAVTGRTNGPRVASRQNAQGTHWVLLCRKAQPQEGRYNDIAMLGHNPYTGKTCYFQNALYSRTDGLRVPHPGDTVASPASPEQTESLWSGIQGGLGSGIQCAECHDSDPFIHSPWIDGATHENGDPIIPKMGITEGFAQGFNSAPYTLVDEEGQGWTMPKHLVSEEASACTKCHRIGDGRFADSWMTRLIGVDTFWKGILTEEGKKFNNVFWMPPEMEGIDEETWAESEFGIASQFIMDCADNPTNPECIWEALPREAVLEFGALPEITIEGEELALEALKVLGANVFDQSDTVRCDSEDNSCKSNRCAECHSVSKNGLKEWQKLTQTAQTKCNLGIDPAELTQEQARVAVNCLRSESDDEDSVFAAEKLGIFTTGARYGDFRTLFQKAYGDDYWLPHYVQFKQRVSMPKGTYAALSQHEYAVLLKWFASDLANLNELIVDPPAPTTCDEFVDDAFAAHMDDMLYDGWGAVNKETGLFMFGCPDQSNTSSCFSEGFNDHTATWGKSKGQLKEVMEMEFRTSFWTRSSADGRFIGNGGGSTGGATITDMVRGIDIPVKSSYDPGFFPDNSGFIFQGGGFGTGICLQAMLETAEEVKYDDPSCIKGTGINLYQHVASALNGGDHFIINSQFTSDAGGSTSNKDPRANFNAQSGMKFSPMINNGEYYEQLDSTRVDSPFEGDSVLSPSGRLVISRLAGGEDGGSLGYVVRRVNTQKFDDSYIVKIDEVLGRYCFSGAKANISFDERYFVTHHYETDGTANIILVDMLTGETHQVTDMPTGYKALFPHFRSDGWFYFLVKTGEKEFVLASDLAVVLSKGTE